MLNQKKAARTICWIALVLPCLVADADSDVERLFEATARSIGEVYELGREELIRRGNVIRELLTEKADSADWQEQWLAGTLLYELDNPDRARLARRVLLKGSPSVLAADSTVLIEYDPAALRSAEESSHEELVLTNDDLPIVVDALRMRTSSHYYETTNDRIIASLTRILGHLKDPGTTAPLLYLCGGLAADAVVSIGEPGLPVLHEVVQPHDDWRDDPAPWARISAAKALGRIGDPISTPVLGEALRAIEPPETGQDRVGPSLVAAYSEALGALQGGEEFASVVFAKLLHLGKGWPDTEKDYCTDMRVYEATRRALLAFGSAARQELEMHTGPDGDVVERTIAAGMLFELNNPSEARDFYAGYGRLVDLPGRGQALSDSRRRGREAFWQYGPRGRTSGGGRIDMDVPVPLCVEFAAASGRGLEELGMLRGEALAFDVLADAVLRRERMPRSTDIDRAIAALGELGNAQAIDVFRTMLRRRPRMRLREIIQAVIVLADSNGTGVLDDIIAREGTSPELSTGRYKDLVAFARLARSVVVAEADELMVMLDSEDPRQREAAVTVLARRRDVNTIPVLLEMAVAARQQAHARWRDMILAMGDVAAERLRQHYDSTEDADEKLLCESLIIWLTEPGVAASFRRAAAVPIPNYLSRLGSRLEDYRAAGKKVAGIVGPEGVALLEAQAVWRWTGLDRSIVAAFALAELKQQRSLEVLARHREGLRYAEYAVTDFGEPGLAVLREAIELDPDDVDFEAQARLHLTAIAALANAQDPGAVEMIIEGLKLCADGHLRSDDARVYVNLAGQCHDERLVGPLIGAARAEGRIADEALRALHMSDDALRPRTGRDDHRIVDLSVECLGIESARRTAVEILVHHKGQAVLLFLAEQLEAQTDEAIRVGIVRSLGVVCEYLRSQRHSPADQEAHRRLVVQARQFVRETAPRLLEDPSPSVQLAAAEVLIGTARGDRSWAIEPLLAWAKKQEELPDQLIRHFVWSRNPEVGPVLLTFYRGAGGESPSLLGALGEIRYEPAVPDVAAAMNRHIPVAAGTRDRLAFGGMKGEMGTLCRLGRAGCDEVFNVLQNEETDLTARAAAANALAAQQVYEDALPLTQELFERLVRNGLDDPGLEAYPGPERRDQYRGVILALCQALTRHDPEISYPLLVSAGLELEDETLRNHMAQAALKLRRQHPELGEPGARPRSPESPDGNED